MPKISIQDRGFDTAILLLPGWSMDSRIFNYLDLPFNYYLVDDLDVTLSDSGLSQSILDALPDDCFDQKIDVLGFSMGAYIATHFASTFPDRVSHLHIYGVRPHYSRQDIQGVSSMIRPDYRAFLKQFYRMSFSGDKRYADFRNALEAAFINQADLDTLMAGLAYLGRVSFSPSALPDDLSYSVHHGTADLIAPFSEIESEMCSVSEHFFPVKGASHVCF